MGGQWLVRMEDLDTPRVVEGMEQDMLVQAPEPFFTTKEPGKGLGLGLYLAETVAELFGGEMRIFSEKGKGTQVTLSFALARVGAG